MKCFRYQTSLSTLQFYTNYGKVIDKKGGGKMEEHPGNLRLYNFKRIFCFQNVSGMTKKSRKRDLFIHCYTDNWHYSPAPYVKE